MKKLVMAVLVLAGTASSALAAGPYIGGSTGLTIFHEADVDGGYDTIRYNGGPAVNVLGGYNFGGLRLEGEYGYKHADVDSVSGYRASGMDTAVHSLMGNILYEFIPMRVATPVVGVGFGALWADFGDRFASYHDTRPGYQVTAGAAFHLGKRVDLDVFYRLQGAFGDFDIADSNISYMSSNILVGARYNF